MDVTLVRITRTNGVIRLKGHGPHASAKVRIEGVIRPALHTAALPYARLITAWHTSHPGLPHRLPDRPAPRAPPLSAG